MGHLHMGMEHPLAGMLDPPRHVERLCLVGLISDPTASKFVTVCAGMGRLLTGMQCPPRLCGRLHPTGRCLVGLILSRLGSRPPLSLVDPARLLVYL